MPKKLLLLMITVFIVVTLAGCGEEKKEEVNHENMNMESNSNAHEGMDMNHSGSGELPKGLNVSENPTFEVGSQAIIQANHMEGMNGAEATIVGAFDTTAYIISYTPTNGGERVTDHKWVIQEEIKDAGEETFETGSEVIIEADHMEGMDGAIAEIDSSEKTVVYMIDYTSTTGGEKVTNHKWVTESELSKN